MIQMDAHCLLDVEPRDLQDLDALLRARSGEAPDSSRIAVDATIIDSRGRWLLHRRGPACRDEVGRLEGLGGAVEAGQSFRGALLREVREEAGDEIVLEVTRFLEVRWSPTHEGSLGGWLVISYLCLLQEGEPRVMEPDKNDGFVWIDIRDPPLNHLSSSAQRTYQWLISGA